MYARLTFLRLTGIALAIGAVVGFGAYAAFGTPRNAGTVGAIGSEDAVIMAAEKASCHKYGSYASIEKLRAEGLLASAPVYNSIVILPGKGCGTVVVGSPSYQSPS